METKQEILESNPDFVTKTVLCAVVYVLVNPLPLKCIECLITIDKGIIWLQWNGTYNWGGITQSCGETGGFNSIRAAKMYVTKQGLSTGKSRWEEKIWSDIFPTDSI